MLLCRDHYSMCHDLVCVVMLSAVTLSDILLNVGTYCTRGCNVHRHQVKCRHPESRGAALYNFAPKIKHLL